MVIEKSDYLKGRIHSKFATNTILDALNGNDIVKTTDSEVVSCSMTMLAKDGSLFISIRPVGEKWSKEVEELKEEVIHELEQLEIECDFEYNESYGSYRVYFFD